MTPADPTSAATLPRVGAPPAKLPRRRLPRRLRNIELLLLLFAFGINAYALMLVRFGLGLELDTEMLQLAILPTVIVLGLHVVLRISAPDADPFMLPIVTLINGLGIAMIHRIDIARGDSGWDSFAVRQLAWAAIAAGVAIAAVLLLRNHRVLQRYNYLAMAAGVILLLLPLLPGIGVESFGAKLWVDLGVFTFQPGEFAKIALAVFFAGYLVTHRDSLSLTGKKFLGLQLPRARDLGPILFVWAASIGVLVLQRDLGTALLYFGLFVVMLYLATGRSSWILLGLGLFVAGAAIAVQFLPHVSARFRGWLAAFDPNVYEAVGGSYQLVQGLFGLANGGMLGTGFGRGRPTITPLAESDYIIASLGEETGLAGLFAILVLYLLLISRGIRIGFAGQDDFTKLLASGLAFVIALQCFIVIGGVTRIIPLTGLTTPLLAAGGSSLVANWLIVGLLLRLSDTVRNQPRLVV